MFFVAHFFPTISSRRKCGKVNPVIERVDQDLQSWVRATLGSGECILTPPTAGLKGAGAGLACTSHPHARSSASSRA